MTKLTLLTAMMAAAMVTVGAIKALAPVTSAITTPQSASMDIEELQPASMDIEELQRKIDVRSLPELEIHDLY
jgi:hypothetical protein